MEGSDDKIGIRNRLINGGQRVSDGFGLLEIRINRLSALLEVKELKLESCSTGCRFLSKMTRQAIPDAFRSVKPNGKASYIFSEGCIEDAHNLLIYCNPIVMLQIRNSFGRSVSGCRSGDGDCWLRNSPINIPPEISTTEGCWRRSKEPLRKRKEEKTREHK